jgi:hypothetical protein
MLYIEPVYVQTTATDAFPLMQLVLMSYGQYVTLAPTVEDGLADLVEQGQAGVPTLPEGEEPTEPPPGGTPGPTTEPPPEPTEPPATEPPPDLAEAEARMAEADQELVAAYDSGDFARLADALEEWVAAREALDAAQAAGGG